MRLTIKRVLIFSYLVICAIFSFFNYPQKTRFINPTDDQPSTTFESKLPHDDRLSNESLWRRLKAGFENFIPQGIVWPDSRLESMKISLWPEDSNSTDRIMEQMSIILPDRNDRSRDRPDQISIYLPHGVFAWNVQQGDKEFRGCPISNCRLTDFKKDASIADAVMFRNTFHAGVSRSSDRQIWIYYALESPENTPSLAPFGDQINWTATYRHDSDIVAPYEKFHSFSPERLLSMGRSRDRVGKSRDDVLNDGSHVNYAKGKTKNVAWFVSNCLTNNRRREYAQQLAQYIQVDIYGSCGQLRCSRRDSKCNQLLDDEYRFYLAFENSNCQDYITEKFFIHGLQHNIIPIVMGARKVDYVRSSPPHSFIHVDDFETPAQLASYLNTLAKNDTLYNEYFKWKGTGEFMNTKFWCRLCAMLNRPKEKFYSDVELWWHGPGVCTRGRWPSTSTSS